MSELGRQICLIVIDVRSAHNVGSLLRTADAMAVDSVWLVGITPYPAVDNDKRLPHIAARADSEIRKTALGAEKSLDIRHLEKSELGSAVEKLRAEGYSIVALEQTASATDLSQFQPADKVALMVGNEVEGLDADSLNLADQHVAIPMLGAKESLNVAVAAGMALYQLRFG